MATRRTTLSVAGGGDLAAAAEVIADGARGLAGSWSSSIPPSITTEVSGKVATITVNAPAGYPNEVAGVRHPTFGHEPWVNNKHRPFLGPALDARGDAAMARYAKKIDRMLSNAGFH